MNLEFLRSLVAIAEHGSFAAAARMLNLSQSAVSLHIRTLETEFACPLFDRSKRPPILTHAGTQTVVRAKDLLGLAEELRSSLATMDQVRGRLQLGAVGSALTGLLPVALTAISSRHPGLHLEIVSGVSGELLAMVERRRLDAAVISDYSGDERAIDWRPFLRERLVLIAPPDTRGTDPHKLARSFPFIRYTTTAALGRVINDAIHGLRLDVRESMRLDRLEAIEAMVFHGHGIAIVPERRFEALSRVRVVSLGTTAYFRILGLIEPAHHPKRLLTDTVFTELAQVVGHPVSGRRGLLPKPAGHAKT